MKRKKEKAGEGGKNSVRDKERYRYRVRKA